MPFIRRRRSNKKKPAARARKAVPRRARRAPAGGSRKIVVKPATLGSLTHSKLAMTMKPDHRAKVMKLVSTPSNRNQSYPIDIFQGSSGLQAWQSDIFAAQSELNQINTDIGLANGVQGVAPCRYLLENLAMTYEFTNRSTAPVILRAYIVKPKRDTWYTATVGLGTGAMTYVGPNGASFPWGGDPVTAIQQGYNAQTNASSLANLFYNPAVKPTTVDLFNQYYNIEREVEINLGVGCFHRMEINQHYDRVLDGSVFGNTPLTAIRGITGYVLFRAEGVPGVDIADSVNYVTTCPVKISCVHTRNYRYTQIFSPIVHSDNATTLFVDAAPTMSLINPGTGTVENVAYT